MIRPNTWESKAMWDSAKQEQFDGLSRRAQQGSLSDAELHQLDALLHEIEHEEWAALRPALDTMRHEQAQLAESLGDVRTDNAILAALAERFADLLARTRTQLAGLLHERETLRAEYERVLG